MILVDTGVLLAAANQNESAHKACSTLLADHSGALLVSPLVVAEVCYMLDTRHGPEAEALFLTSLADGSMLLGRAPTRRSGADGRAGAPVRGSADRRC